MTKEEEKFLMLMGKRIRELRIKAGYNSQESFAYDANIPRAQYGRYEAGTNITVLSLNKILKFHKITTAEFFSNGFDKSK